MEFFKGIVKAILFVFQWNITLILNVWELVANYESVWQIFPQIPNENIILFTIPNT